MLMLKINLFLLHLCLLSFCFSYTDLIFSSWKIKKKHYFLLIKSKAVKFTSMNTNVTKVSPHFFSGYTYSWAGHWGRLPLHLCYWTARHWPPGSVSGPSRGWPGLLYSEPGASQAPDLIYSYLSLYWPKLSYSTIQKKCLIYFLKIVTFSKTIWFCLI